MADNRNMRLRIEVEEETDGRWIADIPDLPGVMAYGESKDASLKKVGALALRVLADRIEHDESGHLASFEVERG